MLSVPTTSNSVYISMIQDGCCEKNFDTTYPVHLNGIVTQDEFAKVIKKLNRTIFSCKARIAIFFAYFVVVTIALIMILMDERWQKNAGIALMTVGMGGFFIIIFGMPFREAKRMREIVAEESKKYSTRSPIPCSWRLETTWFYEVWGNGQNRATYRIIIDIGCPATGTSGGNYFNQGEQNQYVSPAYGSIASLCSKCGATRADLSDGFCSSCGQAFPKY